MTGKYILQEHQPVLTPDAREWAIWFETANRTVARTKIGPAEVSTVFLGLDHNFTDEGPPVLFETMVFGGSQDQQQERYCTWEEAEAGHAKMVKRVKVKGSVSHLVGAIIVAALVVAYFVILVLDK